MSESVVGLAELTRMLAAMHERRGLLTEGGPWAISGGWRSFKADFIAAQNPSGHIAVKFGDGWTPRDARYVSAEIERVRKLFLSLPSGPVRVPSCLGWSEVPAAVALPLVAGTPLFELISNRSHPIWHRGEQLFTKLARQCGEAIGAYHNSEPAPDDQTSRTLSIDDLLTAAKRAGVRRSVILRVEPQLPRARGYRFSPNDLLINGSGQLVMLDPPHLRKYDYLPRDLSAFTFELRRAIVGEAPARGTQGESSLYEEVRSSFLEGYGRTGPSTLTSELDRWVLRVFEISRVTGLAYARLKRRAVRRSLPTMAWAAQLRSRLGAPPLPMP